MSTRNCNFDLDFRKTAWRTKLKVIWACLFGRMINLPVTLTMYGE